MQLPRQVPEAGLQSQQVAEMPGRRTKAATQHETGHGGRWNSAQVEALRQHPEVQLAEARLVHPAPVRTGSGAGEFTLMGKAADIL